MLLIMATVISVTDIDGQKVSAASKNTAQYFTYRVDVMDCRKASYDSVMVDILSSVDGAAYIYIVNSGEKKPSVKDIMGSGNKTLIPAKEETVAYGHMYWLDKVEEGKKYDIYIVFEDAGLNTYGPYAVKGWTAKYLPAGNGSKKNPYQIWTDTHLYNMNQFTGEDYKNTYFKVMQDIDLSESTHSGRIVDYASDFYGVFDGNGKTIRNLYGTLFYDLTETAVVKNVYVANADSTHGSSSGYAGIIADSNKGTIENCVVYKSKIDNSLDGGVITGINFVGGKIKKCAVVDCTLIGFDDNGAMAGRNYGDITDCYAKIKFIADTTLGGIAGRHDSGTISGCLAEVTVVPETDDGDPRVGGIVGYIAGENAIVKNNVSLYTCDPERLGHSGSVWGTFTSSEYIENAFNNKGLIDYSYDSISLTAKEYESYSNDEYRAKMLAEKKERWVSHHGAPLSEMGKVKNPVQKLINKVNAKGKNKVKLTGVKLKFTHAFQNETAAYSKKFKMTQKKLSLKKSSVPAKTKLNATVDAENEEAKLTWSKVKKADGYIIYRATWENGGHNCGKYGEYEKYETINNGNTTEYLSKYLYSSKKYYYRIRAYYTVNGKQILGPYSNIKEVKFNK